MIIGKQYKFDSAHYLPGHPKCGQYHGHTWTVDVNLGGPTMENGMVLDFHSLNHMMDTILGKLDHQLLNNIVANPTCENLSHYLLKELMQWIDTTPWLEHITYVKLKIQEGSGGYCIISYDYLENEKENENAHSED